jgi:hypothetical protein
MELLREVLTLPVSSTLTFNLGETSKSITVLINGDIEIEPNETFFVNLSNAANPQSTTTKALALSLTMTTLRCLLKKVHREQLLPIR